MFRAWIKKENTFLYEFFIDSTDGQIIITYKNYPVGSYPVGSYKKDEAILEQFIGLRDKNDKKIYENDIIMDNKGNRGIVFYDSEYAQFSIKWAMDDDFSIDSFFKYSEVIGNIHQNPEYYFNVHKK